MTRKDAGVVDRDGLENRCTLMGTQGSNPCLSATRGPLLEPQTVKTSDYQLVLRFCCIYTLPPQDIRWTPKNGTLAIVKVQIRYRLLKKRFCTSLVPFKYTTD